MSYIKYERDIVSKYKVKLVGWPLTVKFANPSEIGTVDDIRHLRQVLKIGECKWVVLTRRQQIAHEEIFAAKVASGELVGKKRKERSDKGKTRGNLKGTKKPGKVDRKRMRENNNSEGDEDEDDAPAPPKKKKQMRMRENNNSEGDEDEDDSEAPAPPKKKKRRGATSAVAEDEAPAPPKKKKRMGATSAVARAAKKLPPQKSKAFIVDSDDEEDSFDEEV
jgi:hypothetical protein